jgi:monoamine oxidase
VVRPVVIVGAGLAGMTTALDLVDRGIDVVVLEARDRVGGRVLTHHFDDTMHAELGGESIDENHKAMLALLDRFRLTTERRPVGKTDDSIVHHAGARMPLTAFLGLRDGAVGADYFRFLAELDIASAGVDPEYPERFDRAAELDSLSLDDFIAGLDLVPEADFLVRLEYRAEYNAEPVDLSMLFIAQQNEGEDPGPSGVETMRIRGGNSRLTTAMATALGDRIRLSRAVTVIEHTDDGVVVGTGSSSIDGSYVVLAAPPPPVRTIAFLPALDAAAATMIAELDLGPAAKVVSEYVTRFWTPITASGSTLSELPFHVAWAATDSYESRTGVLSQFITGDGAMMAAALDDENRIAAFGAMLDEVYPEGVAHRTGRHATIAWPNEPFTGGGYAVFRPGQMVPFWPVLREGRGRIKFAGEHTEVLIGYMESAIRSGHRIAAEIVDETATVRA